MISRTPVAVGAILLFQTISLGSNNNAAVHASNESGNLRRRLSAEEKQDERDLAPFGFGQGYGYTKNSNRYSYPRTRGGVLGAQVMRPYEPDASQQPYRGSNRDNIFDPPPPPPPFTGGPPKAGKSSKAAKAAKASKKGYYNYYDNNRPARINQPPPPPRGVGGAPPPPRGSGSVTRQGEFADAFTWTRVPGQPMFISQTETPIIVLDVPFQVGFDEDGNFFLVDQEGKEITVVFNEDGTFEVIEEVRPPIISFDDNGNWLIRPRDQETRDPTPKPTELETGTSPPTITEQPTTTPQPTEFCTDDEDFRFNGNDDQDCEFVGENPDVRCDLTGATESCRLSCNELCETTPGPTPTATDTPQDTAGPTSAGTCKDDPDFRINGNENQDCEYVAANTANRCSRTGATEACPSVCNPECESTATAAPSSVPTSATTTAE